jgi:hypothetical protein
MANRNLLLLCVTMLAAVILSRAMGQNSESAGNTDAVDLATRRAFEDVIRVHNTRLNELEKVNKQQEAQISKLKERETSVAGLLDDIGGLLSNLTSAALPAPVRLAERHKEIQRRLEKWRNELPEKQAQVAQE